MLSPISQNLNLRINQGAASVEGEGYEKDVREGWNGQDK